jgi:mannose-6-phosphate isomerase-like protein (cupin superfamily)
MSEAWVRKLDEALAPLPLPATSKWPDGEPYQCVLNQPGAQILIFAPRGTDHQTPHNRDEAYFVMTGSATLEIEGEPYPVSAGDVAWVPKNMEHRFINISDDFVTWVAFFG